jgi:AcrR family transcriptional regulator
MPHLRCESLLTFARWCIIVKVRPAHSTPSAKSSGASSSARAGGAAKRPKDRRAQIALAAAELFCARGYPDVGIDEIAEAVGISGPAIYRHFPTKYDLLAHATRELSGEILRVTADTSTLDDLLAALARLAVRRRRVGGLYQWQGRYLVGEDRVVLRTALGTVLDRLAVPIALGRPELSTSDLDLVARTVLSAMGSLATHRAPAPAVRAERILRDAAGTLIQAPLDAAAPRHRPPAAEVSPASSAAATRREALLAAALPLFHRDGYHAVSMEDIGRAAGIAASSVYRHFGSKAELLAAVYHGAARRVAEMTAAALADATGPQHALDRLVDSYVDLVVNHPALVSVYATTHGALSAADRHELRKAQRLHVEEWVRLIVEVRADRDAVAARLLAHAALNLILDLAPLRPDDPWIVAGLASTLFRAGSQP